MRWFLWTLFHCTNIFLVFTKVVFFLSFCKKKKKFTWNAKKERTKPIVFNKFCVHLSWIEWECVKCRKKAVLNAMLDECKNKQTGTLTNTHTHTHKSHDQKLGTGNEMFYIWTAKYTKIWFWMDDCEFLWNKTGFVFMSVLPGTRNLGPETNAYVYQWNTGIFSIQNDFKSIQTKRRCSKIRSKSCSNSWQNGRTYVFISRNNHFKTFRFWMVRFILLCYQRRLNLVHWIYGANKTTDSQFSVLTI